MRIIDLTIPEIEFERLTDLFPPTGKRSSVGDRAMELVKFHFRTADVGCQFRMPNDGTDSEIIHADASSERIEIKGTAGSDIWAKLKVSGKSSYERLREDVLLYRVVDVNGRTPSIFVLKHSEDFEIIPEDRWALKARR